MTKCSLAYLKYFWNLFCSVLIKNHSVDRSYRSSMSRNVCLFFRIFLDTIFIFGVYETLHFEQHNWTKSVDTISRCDPFESFASCAFHQRIRFFQKFHFTINYVLFHWQTETPEYSGRDVFSRSRAHSASRIGVSWNASRAVFASSYFRFGCECAKFQIGPGLYAVLVCQVSSHARDSFSKSTAFYTLSSTLRIDIALRHIIVPICSQPNEPINWPYFCIMWQI